MFIEFTLENIARGILSLICAFLVSYSVLPFVSKLAWKIGAVDIPDGKRRMHSEVIPRMGGLAIFIAYVVTAAIFVKFELELLFVFLGACLIVAIGIVDDRYQIKAWQKLLGQIVAAVVAAIGGPQMETVHVGGKVIELGVFSIPITVIWIVVLINAVNLIDGLDGLSCGISTISAFALLFVALRHSDGQTALMILALCGACLGFLPSNTFPAKIFMGDTGAMFIGYMMGVLSVRGMFKLHALVSFVVPLFIFAIPLFDTCFAFFRRLLTGKNPFKADRGHIHHILVDAGFSHQNTVHILHTLSGILAIGAVLTAYEAVWQGVAIIVVGIVIGTLYFIYSIKNKNNN